MKPSPELVTDSPQPFCLANPGKEYVVYLRYGGMMHLDMSERLQENHSPVTGIIRLQENQHPKRQVTGGRKVQFTAPGMYPGTLDYSDWVLHVFSE
jgi:hypothetical protein